MLQELERGTAGLQAAWSGSTVVLQTSSATEDQHHSQQQQQQHKPARQAPAGPTGDTTLGCSSYSRTVLQCTDTLQATAADTAAHCAKFADGCAASSSSSSSSRQLAVDVLVPTARLDLGLLQGIADALL
jgi:hypothetical protein